MAKLFGRVAKVTIPGREFTYPELQMVFEIKFDTKSSGNTGTLIIYNLSQESEALFKNGITCVVEAGYKDFNGIIFNGIVKNATTNKEGADTKIEITLDDNTNGWTKTKIKKNFGKGTTTSSIVNNILSNLKQYGIIKGVVKPKVEHKYTKGITFNENTRTALEKLANDAESVVYILNGKLYFKENKTRSDILVVLNQEVGGLKNVQKTDLGWKITTLLNHQIMPDTYIRLKSRTTEGDFRVINCEHKLNADTFETVCEVITLEEDENQLLQSRLLK